MTVLPADASDSIAELADVLHGLERALVKATRVHEGLTALTPAEVRLLRRVTAAGGLTPAEAASSLGLTRPTISELVGRLVESGLVERRPIETDGRSVQLVPTERAALVLNSFRQGRARVTSLALDELTARERARLLADLPALNRLLDALSHLTPDPHAASESDSRE